MLSFRKSIIVTASLVLSLGSLGCMDDATGTADDPNAGTPNLPSGQAGDDPASTLDPNSGTSSQEPGNTDPNTQDPANEDPSNSNPGNTDPNSGEPENQDPGSDDPGSSDPGTDDPNSNEAPFPVGTDPSTDDPNDPNNGNSDPEDGEDSKSDNDPSAGQNDQPDFDENGGGKVSSLGWQPSKAIEPWAIPFQVLPFPTNLPDRPEEMKNPKWMPWCSGRSLQVHNDEIFVVNTENNNLVVLNRKSGKAKRVIALGDRPEQVVVDAKGNAFVTIRYAQSVARIDANAATVSKTVKVGVEPYGLALNPEQDTLYVSLSGEDKIIALKAKTLMPLGTIATDERPRSMAVNPLGEVFVSQQYGGMTRIIVDALKAPKEIVELPMRKGNPADFELHKIIGAGKAETNIQTRAVGCTVHPETGTVFATHVQAQPGSEEVSLNTLMDLEPELEEKNNTECATNCAKKCKKSGGYGGSVCSNVCKTSCVTTTETLVKSFPHIIRPLEVSVSSYPTGAKAPQATEIAAPVKDKITKEPMPALIDKPWDINHHPKLSLAMIVGKGTDNLLVVGTNGDPMRNTIAEIKTGHAPKAVSFSNDGQFAYVLNSHDFTVSEIDLSALFNMKSISNSSAPSPGFGFTQFNSGKALTEPLNLEHAKVSVFGVDPLAKNARLGRRMFEFARNPGVSFNGHFACSTCHFEGTEDHLVWFVSDGPRQTPILAGKLKGTGPFNWMGTAHTIQKNFTNTVTRMGGDGLTQDQLNSLEVFVMDHLVPPPNPHSTDVLTESQQKGKELFYHPQVGCSDCHSGPALTDGKNYDVGTTTKTEKALIEKGKMEGLKLNTPSIRSLYYSAPYLHDGSAKTLFDVINMTADGMGHSYSLTGQQQIDLVNYLLTL